MKILVSLIHITLFNVKYFLKKGLFIFPPSHAYSTSMKQNILLLFIVICLLLLPFLLIKEKHDAKSPRELELDFEIECPILIEVKGEQQKIPLETYVLGVVAAEMPISFHE